MSGYYLRVHGGSLAHFELAPGQTSRAVVHQKYDEIWYFLNGQGEMWRKLGDQNEVVPVLAGTCVTIPAGTHWQFRAFGDRPLAVVGVTLPPWNGDDYTDFVEGEWPST